MNFEVSGGKVYKEASCRSLGSNWERIERSSSGCWAGAAVAGSNWERIES